MRLYFYLIGLKKIAYFKAQKSINYFLILRIIAKIKSNFEPQ